MLNLVLWAAIAVIVFIALMLIALNLGAFVGEDWCKSHKDEGLASAVLAVIAGILMAVVMIVGMNNTFGNVGLLGCIAATITGIAIAFQVFLICLTWNDNSLYWTYYNDYFRYMK